MKSRCYKNSNFKSYNHLLRNDLTIRSPFLEFYRHILWIIFTQAVESDSHDKYWYAKPHFMLLTLCSIYFLIYFILYCNCNIFD